MRIALLESLTFGFDLLDSAAEQLGARLTLLTRNDSVYLHELPHVRNIDVHQIDTLDFDAVLDYLQRESFDGLLTNTDTWSIVGARLQERLGLRGRRPHLAQLLRNKPAVRGVLREAGLSNLQAFALQTGEGEALAWEALPSAAVVVKPIDGTGSSDIFAVSERTEYESLVQDLQEQGRLHLFLAEPLLLGPLLSAESLIDGGKTQLVGITNRGMSQWPEFREEWGSFPAHDGSPFEKEVAGWIDRIHTALDIVDGATHIEFIRTVDGLELVEVNARLGGALVAKSIYETTGINPYLHLLAQSVGLDVPVQKTLKNGGFAWFLTYASSEGFYRETQGLHLIEHFPGEPAWHPTKVRGSKIASSRDQGAAVGVLSACGSSATGALENVLAASNVLRVAVE